MENYGFLLKKIREEEKISIKRASQLLNKSTGWISEIENGRGNSKLSKIDFDSIVSLYNGWKYKPRFGIWITHNKKYCSKDNFIYEGAAFKYFRTRKKLSQKEVSTAIGITPAYLSMIENEREHPTEKIRQKLLSFYNQSVKNFRKYTNQNEKAKSVPSRFKIFLLLQKLNDEDISKIFNFATNLVQEGEKEC